MNRSVCVAQSVAQGITFAQFGGVGLICSDPSFVLYASYPVVAGRYPPTLGPMRGGYGW